MRVAARRIGETTWVHTPALATVHVKSWDQHRFMELAFDPDGRLHVIGNMHGVSIGQTNLIEVCCSPLQYFRTPDPVDDPADVLTLVRSTMVSPNVDVPLPFEDVTTYPGFFSDGERFFFVYRDGFSNGGEWYVHQLNRTTGQWFSPNGNQPWYSGVRNAAPPPSGFLNPQTTGFYFAFGLHDGRFWIAGYDAWLYASSCAATAVDGRCSMSWITTADFDHFHDVASAELQTPILPTNRSAAAVVDPAPYGGLWGSTVDFDEQGHPMLVYGRHAASRVNAEGKLEGNYQAYFARWNGSQWQRVQLSSWPQWTTRSPSLGVIPSIVGPVVDAGGVSHWYVRMTVFDEPPNTRSTGWLEIDLATLATTPAPSFQPPTTSCASGSTATVQPPVQYPDWIEPQNGIVLVPRIRRSNVRPYGLGEEAGAYYYLSWNATSAEPVPASVAGAPPPADPPLVALSVRRTTCVK